MEGRIILTENEINDLQRKYRALWEVSMNKDLPERVRKTNMDKREGFAFCLFSLRLRDQVGIRDIDREYLTKV